MGVTEPKLARSLRVIARRAGPVVSLVAAALAIVVLGLFVAALGLSFYVPLMTDEVSTKVAYAHVFEERGNFVTLLPMCSASWVRPVPLPLLPGAVLTTLISGGVGLMGIRVVGIALSVLAFCGVAWIAWSRLETRIEKLWVTGALAAMACLGVVPFVLVLSRAEQILKVCMVGFAVIAMLSQRAPRMRAAPIALPVAFLLLASLFFFTHPKALFFLPFVLFAGWLATSAGSPRARRWSRAIVMPVILVLAVSSLRMSADSVRCDEDPALSKFSASLWLAPKDLVREPGTFLRAGFHNLADTPERAWKEVLFAANNTGWVPLPRSRRLPAEMRALNEQSEVVFVALFAIAPLLLVLAWRARGPIARSRVLLGTSLAASLAANAFFYNTLPFYNVTLIVPSLGLVAALAIAADRKPIVPRPFALLAICGFFVIAGQNLVALVGHFSPRLVLNASRVGPVVPDQPLAVPIFGYDAEVPKIRALAKACGIDGDGSKHLVIDDYTAFAFVHLHESINMLYVTDVISLFGKPLEGAKVRPFLRNLASPGVIGRCWLFPKALRSAALRSGDYCCVGASGLEDPR